MLAGLAPSEAWRKNLFCASLLTAGGLLAIFGVLWLMDVLPPIPAFTSTWHSPRVSMSRSVLLVRAPVILD